MTIYELKMRGNKEGIEDAERSFAALAERRVTGRSLEEIQKAESEQLRERVAQFRLDGISEESISEYITAHTTAFVNRQRTLQMEATGRTNRAERRRLESEHRRMTK